MEILKAFRVRLVLNEAQNDLAYRVAGSCRFLKNLALEQRSLVYRNSRRSVGFNAQCLDLTQLKKDLPWLNEAPSQVLQQALKDMGQAFQNFFDGFAEHPTFHKKGQRDSFRFPQGFEVVGKQARIYLPKFGWVAYRQGRGKAIRPFQGEIRSITMSREGDSWFASILCKQEAPEPRPIHGFAVGVDLGVKVPLALSTGEVLDIQGMTANEQVNLAKSQRVLARMVKFSKNWVKQKRKIAKLHQTVAHRRRDGINKATTYLAKNHRLVVVEDLRLKNMTKAPAAKPDPEQEGSFLPNGAAAKAGLNRVILDKALGEVLRQ